MYKLGQVPSLRAGIEELADYVEVECLRQTDRNASIEDVLRSAGRVAEDLEDDREQQDIRSDTVAVSIAEELVSRVRDAGLGLYRYPFRFDGGRYVLFLEPAWNPSLYLFLLLVTRENMRDSATQGGVNGTDLFEDICGEVARQYWGPRAESLVFGTARRRRGDIARFTVAVNDMCTRIREGRGFQNNYGRRLTVQDDNLDLVVWSPFSDRRGAQAIAFGQCKTGTSWTRNDVMSLNPRAFMNSWVHPPFLVPPMPLFFVAARVHPNELEGLCVSEVVLFDRCRIVDYAPDMANLRPSWERWVQAELRRLGYPPL
jgi:hypothetical protein